ncbi:MAG: hypothetical protein V2I27_15350 [Erythrobacter sp.]|jgi:hypothetical protein|nr:hypothetical protein [Erythrobacter sp.]
MKALPHAIAALLALAPPCSLAAADHASEPATALVAFMTAFDAQDADSMRAMAVEGASVTVIEEREGEDRVRAMPLERLIASIAASTSDLAEPIWNLKTIEAGPVATVSADYEFLIDGERSHCGVNIVNLVRVDGAWKIAGIAYSHIETDCTGAPAR